MPDALERLLGGSDPPATPRREFADALLDQLLTALTDDSDTSDRPAEPAKDDPRRRETPPVLTSRPRFGESQLVVPRRWRPAWLAAVAILLVMAMAAYLVLGPGRSDHRVVPAVVVVSTATATPVPGVTQREILEVEIPAEAVPAGRAGVSLHHLTLAPGARTLAPGGHNVHFRYLFAGMLDIRANRLGQIYRTGSGTWEPVPANTDVTLEPGDAVLFLVVTDIEFANRGSVPAEMLAYGLTIEGEGGPGGSLSDWTVNDHAFSGPEYEPSGPGIVLPGRAAVVRVSRAEVEPGASIPTPPLAQYRLVVALPDDALGTPVVPYLTRRPDGGIGYVGRNTVVYSVTLEIPGAEGTPLAATPDP